MKPEGFFRGFSAQNPTCTAKNARADADKALLYFKKRYLIRIFIFPICRRFEIRVLHLFFTNSILAEISKNRLINEKKQLKGTSCISCA